MNTNINNAIQKNKNILTKMVEQNAPYEKILKQSKLLDKYIFEQMIKINKQKKYKF